MSLVEFLAATAALEAQMFVRMSVTLATTVLDFWRTSKGLLKDFQRTPKDLQNLLVYKSQPPGHRDLFKDSSNNDDKNILKMEFKKNLHHQEFYFVAYKILEY